MFNNSFKKQDPELVGAIKTIMQESLRRNEIERKLNEELGIASRKAIPHEHKAEYDTVLQDRYEGLASAISEEMKNDLVKIQEQNFSEVETTADKYMKSFRNSTPTSAPRMVSEQTVKEAKLSKSDQEAMDAVGMDAVADEKGNVSWDNKGFKKPPAKMRPKKKMNENMHLAALHEEIGMNLLERVHSINEQYGEKAVQYFYDNLNEEQKEILDTLAARINDENV